MTQRSWFSARFWNRRTSATGKSSLACCMRDLSKLSSLTRNSSNEYWKFVHDAAKTSNGKLAKRSLRIPHGYEEPLRQVVDQSNSTPD